MNRVARPEWRGAGEGSIKQRASGGIWRLESCRVLAWRELVAVQTGTAFPAVTQCERTGE